MATFVKILNKEDISTMDNRDSIREVNINKKDFIRKKTNLFYLLKEILIKKITINAYQP